MAIPAADAAAGAAFFTPGAGDQWRRKVTTTLDAGLQRQLEDLALNWKSRLPPRSSLAIVVVDHTDMKVRGWVGSADITDDSRFGHIDMVSAVRSPGSVLKPFVYAMAMDDGADPSGVVITGCSTTL